MMKVDSYPNCSMFWIIYLHNVENGHIQGISWLGKSGFRTWNINDYSANSQGDVRMCLLLYVRIWGFPKMVVPQDGWWKSWKTLFFNGWFGGKTHYFRKPPYIPPPKVPEFQSRTVIGDSGFFHKSFVGEFSGKRKGGLLVACFIPQKTKPICMNRNIIWHQTGSI